MSFADGEAEYVRKNLYAYRHTLKSRIAVVLTSKLAPTMTILLFLRRASSAKLFTYIPYLMFIAAIKVGYNL